MRLLIKILLFTLFLLAAGCSSLYFSALDSIGIPKRDIMVHRVEAARDTQQETKAQFRSALEKFTALSHYQGGELESVYQQLNDEYEASKEKAEEIRKRIADIQEVSEALFAEWAEEITQYSSATLKHNSQRQLSRTKSQYALLIASMKRAEAKMDPVLVLFRDQVLYLKHNLNARAISALKGELKSVESDVTVLIKAMEKSIDEANAFIRTIED